ncbi:putative ARM-like repeat-containing protein [Metarhizium anisopliae]
MGKSRRNRAGTSQRRDPLAKPVKAPSDPELAALREAKIIPVINDLQNPDPKSRSAAAVAVANIIQDTKCRKLLLREQIVHIILTQTLTDAALQSRAAGWCILQGLVLEEEDDFCVHLFRSDILPAIAHAAKNVSDKLSSLGAGSSEFSPPEMPLVFGISASLITLLTTLAEAADDILEAISSNTTIIDFLFVLVAQDVLVAPANTDDAESNGISSLRDVALACLMLLTEENGNLAKKIVTNSKCYQAMSSLKNHATGEGVLACATLHNVFSALEGLKDAPNVTGADDSLLIPTLTKTIATIQPDQQAANGNQNAGIQKAWAPVGRTLWEQVITPILSSDTADVNLATQVTGLAWAVSRSLGGSTPLKGDEHRKFISLYQATKSMEPQDSEDPFQRLGVKCVGVLGQLAADPAPASLNREIGTFLITLLTGLPDTPAADAVEALNQVFDIYSSEGFAYDGEVFWKDNFLNQLELVLPKARAMVKSVDKKTQPELRARADEAVMNLGRFLAYKKKNKPDDVNGS